MIGVKLGHVVENVNPTLWVKHVKNSAYCDSLNEAIYPSTGIKNLYYFNRDACACFYDEDVIFQTDDVDSLSAIFRGIPNHQNQIADGAVNSPLDPA